MLDNHSHVILSYMTYMFNKEEYGSCQINILRDHWFLNVHWVPVVLSFPLCLSSVGLVQKVTCLFLLGFDLLKQCWGLPEQHVIGGVNIRHVSKLCIIKLADGSGLRMAPWPCFAQIRREPMLVLPDPLCGWWIWAWFSRAGQMGTKATRPQAFFYVKETFVLLSFEIYNRLATSGWSHT